MTTAGSGPLRLEPTAERSVRDLLFERGVEFPCGGASQCGGCKVRVLAGNVPVTDEMRAVLTAEEIEAGWRLGCLAESRSAVTLEIAQWSIDVLDDRAEVPFEPAEGLGAVVDVGTTTLVAQLVDRGSGSVLKVETALNPQARFGADLMSRIHHDLAEPGTMTALIREAIGGMLHRLCEERPLEETFLVGNTAMHHFFSGISVEPLAAVPFRSPELGPRYFEARELGWSVKLHEPACFLPCIGGFVGSDLLAGLVATGLFESPEPGALLDLGTNGEIAVGCRGRIRCASTAAGPAFEGGRIGCGMRAGGGAIDGVSVVNRVLECSVIGGGPPRGLCGSGLVDATAAALELGWVAPSGRMSHGHESRSIWQVPWRSPRPISVNFNWPRVPWRPASCCCWTGAGSRRRASSLPGPSAITSGARAPAGSACCPPGPIIPPPPATRPSAAPACSCSPSRAASTFSIPF